MQQRRPEPRHGHRPEHLRRGGGLDPAAVAAGEHGDGRGTRQRPQQHRRQPGGGQPPSPEPVRRSRIRRGADEHAGRGDQRDPPRHQHRDVRGRPPRPVQGDDDAVEHRARRPRRGRRGDEQHARPGHAGRRPGQQAGQGRGRPGHEHGEDRAHAGTQRHRRRETADHDPPGPAPGRREPGHQRRSAVGPGHTTGDGHDGHDGHRRPQPVRRQRPGGEQPPGETAERAERGRRDQHPAVAQGPATGGCDRPQPRDGRRRRVVAAGTGNGRHDPCRVDRHGRRVRARVGTLGPPGRRSAGPRRQRPRRPRRRIRGCRARGAHCATTA